LAVPLLTLSEALRLCAAVQLTLLAALLLRDHRRARVTPATAAFVASVVCYLVLPLLQRHHAPAAARLLAVIGALAVPFAFWLTARLHFDDGFAPRPLPTVVLLGILVAARAAVAPWRYVSSAVALLAVGDALRRIHGGAGGDLLVARLRLRRLVLVASGLYAVLVAIAEAALHRGSRLEALLSLVNDFGLFALVLAVSAVGFRLEPDLLRTVPARELDGLDPALRQRLDRLIQEEQVFRTEGLTIGALARRLGEHEYRVRQLINTQLGFRNFNAFLNHFRVQEARRLLSDPRQTELGVAEIAYRLGYASLGPFNRAFKEITGRTPTEFKKAALGPGTLADSGIGEPPSRIG
jgi:AraC-like DNA-binding protein